MLESSPGLGLFDDNLSDHFTSDQVHEADPSPDRPSAAQRPARVAPPAPTQEQVVADMARSSQGRPASGSNQNEASRNGVQGREPTVEESITDPMAM